MTIFHSLKSQITLLDYQKNNDKRIQLQLFKALFTYNPLTIRNTEKKLQSYTRNIQKSVQKKIHKKKIHFLSLSFVHLLSLSLNLSLTHALGSLIFTLVTTEIIFRENYTFKLTLLLYRNKNISHLQTYGKFKHSGPVKISSQIKPNQYLTS